MAKKNNYVSKKEEKKETKKYKNPTSTIWGKAIILFLALAMLLGILIPVIYQIAINI